MAFAFVRNLKTTSGANIKSFAQILSAERHAKREDLTSVKRKRPGGDHEANHFWSVLGEGLNNGGANYGVAFREHKKRHDVKSERKNAALALHLLVGVSPEWLAETGDPHDLKNPRVRELIDHAKRWAETWMEDGAVWAVRYDTDEVGSGVVDILGSPIRQNASGRGKPKPAISVNKALKDLQDSVGARTSYAAMQTSWATYAQDHLDPALERGEPESEQKHLTPEQFKERIAIEQEIDAKALELAAIESELDGAILELTAGQMDVPAEVKRRTKTESDRLKRERQDMRRSLRAEMEAEHANRTREIAREEATLKQDRLSLDRERDDLDTAQRVLRDAQDMVRRQVSELASVLKQTAEDARLIADVVLRTITGVILGTTKPDADNGFRVPPEDQRIIDRFELRPFLAGIVETVMTFWREARGELVRHRQEAVQEAARNAHPTETPGSGPKP